MLEEVKSVDRITIRALEPAEWADFRDLRLHALQIDPGVFFSSYETELNNTAEEWQSTVQGPAHQVFGLFDGPRLVGITAAFTWREDPSGETAILGMSFLLPEYRSRGLTRLFYKTRLDWIHAQPQFKRIVVSHRASNEASRRAIERHGFLPARRVSRTWPDGATEEEWVYEMRIAD